MKHTLSWYLAWLCWLLTIGIVIGTVVAARSAYENWIDEIIISDFNGLVLLSTLVTATVGALLAARIPRNPIGWLFCLLALEFAVDNFAASYLNVYSPDPAPLAIPVTLARAVVGSAAVTMFTTLTFLLFPTGRPPSRRWHVIVWLSATLSALFVAHAVFAAEHLWSDDSGAPVRNPFRIIVVADIFSIIEDLGPLALIGLFLLSVLSLLIRFRHAQRIERLQIKWLAYCASLALVSAIVAFALNFIPGMDTSHLFESIFFFGLMVNFSLVMPIAISVAVMRYRLFEIDRIINRTLVYGLLTATLLGMYFAIVLGLGTLVRQGTGESSPAIVAISTLVAAALFQPLRSRIQTAVDRRFYRHKYDAARTLERFSARLRNETDLHALTSELQRITQDVMQPSIVSIWMRSDLGMVSLRAGVRMSTQDQRVTSGFTDHREAGSG